MVLRSYVKSFQNSFYELHLWRKRVPFIKSHLRDMEHIDWGGEGWGKHLISMSSNIPLEVVFMQCNHSLYLLHVSMHLSLG